MSKKMQSRRGFLKALGVVACGLALLLNLKANAQIAPYEYGWGEENNLIPLMREAQLQCLDLIPNSGIAITLDIGEEKVIHPAKKK